MGVIPPEPRLNTFTPAGDFLRSVTATMAMPTDMSRKTASSAHSHTCLDDLGLSGWFIGPLSFWCTRLRPPTGADNLLDDSKGTRSWQSQTGFQIGSSLDFTLRGRTEGFHCRQSFSLPAFTAARHVNAMAGLIAIVGRPNVGKSALFNRIAGRRIAIVHDQPGVTRDRVTAEVEWQGTPYTPGDTGGIGRLRREKSDDVIVKATVEQVELAIESASAIIFVVNVQEGITPLDEEVAKRLHRAQRPVLVAVNKVDTERVIPEADEFRRLGFEKIYPVTAIHGEGIDELMSEAAKHLTRENVAADESVLPLPEGEGRGEGEQRPRKPFGAAPLKLAIVGRPNV